MAVIRRNFHRIAAAQSLLAPAFIAVLILALAPYAAAEPGTPDAAAETKAQPSLSAGQPALDSMGEGLERRMALELRDMDIVDALKFLAMKGGINIIAGKDVTGRTSLFLKDVTIKEGLEIILLANNLAYEKRGDILYVMTEDAYKQVHGENFKDSRKVEMITLKYAKPEAIFKALEIVRSEVGKVVVDEESGSVILLDTPERLSAMREIVANLDQVQVTRVFALQYAKADAVAASLSQRLDAKKTGTISADMRNNQVIVSAMSGRMKEVEALIRKLDKKTKQVLLEVRMVKVILNDNFSMGVDWDLVIEEAKKYGLQLFSDFSLPAATVNFFKIAMGSSVTPGKNFDSIIKILQKFGQTKNLSSPSIAVVDGEEAKLLIGTKQAYVTTTVSTGGTTATTAAQVQFVDVGVQLHVTPRINDKGFITMKIKPEVSNVDSTLEYQIAADVTNTVPIVATTSAETTVMVKDGSTVILGGLRKDEKIKNVDKLPLFGDLPYVGAAFRRTIETTEKQEIVVFITPHITTGTESGADKTRKAKGVRGYEEAAAPEEEEVKK